MAETAQPLTRGSSISPDRLDESIQIVGPSDWLPIAVVTVLVVLVLVWSVTGEVGTTVTGRGVLIHPRGVLDLQSLGAGRVTGLRLRTGDAVTRGQVLGLIDQFELRGRLNEDRRLLAELETRDRMQDSAQRGEFTRRRQQTGLTREYASSQADALRKSLADARALQPLLDQRLTSVRALRDAGLLAIAAPEVLIAQQASLENARRLTDTAAQLKQLEVQVAESQGVETSLSRDHLAADSTRRAEMQRLRASIAVAEMQIEKNSQIVALYDGHVLEAFVDDGRIVTSGARLATIQVSDPTAPLINIAYLAVGPGKKVRPGMQVLVTPDGIERQRFGGITATVTAVSDLAVSAEGVRATVGSAELAKQLVGDEPRIEVIARLDAATNRSGYHWSSSNGPEAPMSAGLTGDSRIVVEQRAPITYVLPFLRELTGTR